MRGLKKISAKKMFFFYLLSILYAFPIVDKIGFVAMVVILTAPMLAVFCSQRMKVGTLLLCGVFLIYYTVLLLQGNILRGLYIFALQFLIVLFMCCIPYIYCSTEQIKKFCKKCTKLACILVIYNILLLIVLPRMGINYATFPYALRDVMFGLLLLSLFNREYTKRELYTRALIYFLILFVMSERTMALGMLLLLFSYSTISKIKSTKRLKFIFVVFSIVLLILPFIYVEASKTNVADAVDLVFQQYTGKRFFSGREELWDAAIKMIQEKPLFGHGFDDYYFNRGTKEMSVHNLYLYILLQGGIVNLSLIMGFFYLCFNRLTKGERDYRKNLSLCLLIVCMLLADFGLILFANNILYSIFLWTGVAISLVDRTACESMG